MAQFGGEAFGDINNTLCLRNTYFVHSVPQFPRGKGGGCGAYI